MLSFVFIVIFVKLVHSTEGDCHVNNWPSSCEANFKVGPEKCEPCEAGKYGCNCSQDCTANTFGLNCYFKCNCSVDELCDPAVGCINFDSTSKYKTFTLQSSVSPPPSSSSSFLEDTQDTTPVLRDSATPLTLLNVIIITLVTSLVLVVTLSISCVCFIVRRNSKRGINSTKKTKNSEEISETAEQNPDSHSYLTISERSFHLYAGVHYDEAEERKSLTSLSLHSKGYDTSVSDKSGGSDISVSDKSGGSDDYLTPIVKIVDKSTSGSQSSGGYDDTITKCSETCI